MSRDFVMTTPTPRDLNEYTALRATIRERGTARVSIFAAGSVAWAALAMATTATSPTPLATLVPLLALAAVFEAVFALHVGVERIGRYIHVFHETSEAGAAAWEHAATAFGQPKGAVSVDALFTVPFALAGVINMIPALIVQPTIQEIVFVAGAHVLFGVRLIAARVAAAGQRAIDQRRFEELKSSR
jgi:hypothetical protein